MNKVFFNQTVFFKDTVCNEFRFKKIYICNRNLISSAPVLLKVSMHLRSQLFPFSHVMNQKLIKYYFTYRGLRFTIFFNPGIIRHKSYNPKLGIKIMYTNIQVLKLGKGEVLYKKNGCKQASVL